MVGRMPDRRVLVVDDDADITAILATALIDSGYTPEPVMTANAAREKLANGDFQAAVIDCVLAHEDGRELGWFARQRGVAVVLISGNPTLIEKLPQTGFAYLCKPFRLADLVAAIDAASGSCETAAA